MNNDDTNCVPGIRDDLSSARRDGVEAMRKACVEECVYRANEYARPLRAESSDDRMTNTAVAGALLDAANAIRVLLLPEDIPK